MSSYYSKFLSKRLCNRLEKFLKENRIICDEQIGFKKGCRTSDHILSLKTLIDKAFKKPKYLYCCFIDLRKAFDVVNRTALFAKLSKYNIHVQGNCLQVLKIIYKEVYYSVKLPEGLTHKISSTVGLKQCCILSPTLFSLYINDLVDMFDSTCNPVELQNGKLSCLLYADDIVLLSESANGLQNCIDKLEYFCKKWNLSVYLNKTNVLIFNKAGRVVRNLKFHYCSENIAIA